MFRSHNASFVYMEFGDDGMCGEHKNRRTDYFWRQGLVLVDNK